MSNLAVALTLTYYSCLTTGELLSCASVGLFGKELGDVVCLTFLSPNDIQNGKQQY